MNPRQCECEHDFTLVLTGITELTAEVTDALYEAGCDDATISMRSGRPFMTFTRTAGSIKDAILSAIVNVRKAGVGADVLRVDYCNLVTQADIARRIQRNRQQVHQYVTGVRGPGWFPPPACELYDGTYLYFWCEVADWLYQHNMISEDVLRDAEEVDAINSVLEMEQQLKRNRKLTEEIERAISPAG